MEYPKPETLNSLKRKIDNTPEQDLAPLQAELDGILLYERVGCASG